MELQEFKLRRSETAPLTDSLFERCHWFYALCREYLFRDHTPEIRQALFQEGTVHSGMRLLELGCGPGHYARRFASENPDLEATGIDLSHSLIRWAKSRANEMHLDNCHFRAGDAQSLSAESGSVDVVIVSRLFLIVPRREAVLAEVYRVLKPGGRCFFAEPTSVFTTKLPLAAMRFLSRIVPGAIHRDREPAQAEVMSREDFCELITSQPWSSVEMQHDDWYQSAVCVKGAQSEAPRADAA